MKFSAYKLAAPICLALMLGACATTASETTANKEVDANAEETEVGYDVPLYGELIPQAGKQYSKEEDDRMVCKRVQVTGSKFHKKVCMTWGEWKEREAQGREFMQNQNRRAYQQGNPQGG